MILSLTWNYFAGLDLSWDSINYHYYAGFSIFNDRIDQDFFPAGEQSYFNPIIYIPFFWMIESGWDSLFVASGLAIIHSLNFCLLYLIVCQIVGWGCEKLMIRLTAFILGILSASVWMFVGSSFADLIVSVPQMLAIFCSLKAYKLVDQKSSILYWALASLLFGMAAGLKLSGLIFCFIFAIMIFVVAIKFSRKIGFQLLLVSAFSGLLGFLLASGYWAYLMWERFGNPYFPFFNEVFKSEFYLQDSFSDDRFRIKSFLEIIVFIFRLAVPQGWIYLEKIVPDIRIMVAAILSILYLFFSLKNKEKVEGEGLRALLVFFWVAFCVWSLMSGNGRYVSPIFLLVGPLIILLARTIFNPSKYKIFIMIIVSAQCGVLYTSADTRFARHEWTKDWYDFSVDEHYIKNSYLFLTGDVISFSFLFKYINKDSALINIGGTIFPDSEIIHDVIQQKYKEYKGNVKALFSCDVEGEGIAACIDINKTRFEEYGFNVLYDNCEISSNSDKSKNIVGCSAIFSEEFKFKYKKDIERAAKIFRSFEYECGYLFQVKSAPIKKNLSSYSRYYPGDGVRIFLMPDDRIYLRPVWSLSQTYLGKGSEWLSEDKMELTSLCKKLEKIDFAVRKM